VGGCGYIGLYNKSKYLYHRSLPTGLHKIEKGSTCVDWSLYVFLPIYLEIFFPGNCLADNKSKRVLNIFFPQGEKNVSTTEIEKKKNENRKRYNEAEIDTMKQK